MLYFQNMEFCSYCDELREVNHVLSSLQRKNVKIPFLSSSSFTKMSSSARQHIISLLEEFLSLTNRLEMVSSEQPLDVDSVISKSENSSSTSPSSSALLPASIVPIPKPVPVLASYPIGAVVPLEEPPVPKENGDVISSTPIIMDDLHRVLPFNSTTYLSVLSVLLFLRKNALFSQDDGSPTTNCRDDANNATSNSKSAVASEEASAKSGGNSTVPTTPAPPVAAAVVAKPKPKPIIIRNEPSKPKEAAKPRSGIVKPGVVISERYEIQKKIDRGGFSNLFLAKDLQTGTGVAVKVANKKLHQTKSLEKELNNYEGLLSLNMEAIPNVHFYTENEYLDYSILVMDLLGPSLEDLLEACHQNFSFGTVASIMAQMLEIFKNFHEIGYLHRDVKPENILVGQLNTPDAHKIYLIDFGVSINWRNMKTGRHVSREFGLPKTGTNSYMSVNAHRGRTQGRKDDLEALGYCMYRFLKKEFPWSRYDDMSDCIKGVVTAKMKANMDYSAEFPRNEYPPEFVKYLKYVQDLEFNDEPQYDRLKEKFENLVKSLRDKGEWQGFEWTRPEFFTDNELFQTDKIVRKM